MIAGLMPPSRICIAIQLTHLSNDRHPLWA
jgi:hypothetical protein